MTDSNGPDHRATETPNVVIESPRIRRIITQIMGTIGAVIAVASAVDIAAPQLDFHNWTYPVAAGFAVLTSYYGISVTLPNIPKR